MNLFFISCPPNKTWLKTTSLPGRTYVHPLRWGIRPWVPRNAEARGSQNSAKALTFRRSRVVRIRSSVWVSEYMRCVSKYLYLVTCDYWILGFLVFIGFRKILTWFPLFVYASPLFPTTILGEDGVFFQPPVFQATLRWGVSFPRWIFPRPNFLWRCGEKQAALKVDSAIGNSPKWWWIGSGRCPQKMA